MACRKPRSLRASTTRRGFQPHDRDRPAVLPRSTASGATRTSSLTGTTRSGGHHCPRRTCRRAQGLLAGQGAGVEQRQRQAVGGAAACSRSGGQPASGRADGAVQRAGEGGEDRGPAPGKLARLEGGAAAAQRPRQTLLRGLPDRRDRAPLAVMLGAALRREEVASLAVEHIQQREARWVIVDLLGKRGKGRSIPSARG